MDAQEFLTVSFEFVAVVPLVLMVLDFLLNKTDSLAVTQACVSENETDVVVESKVQGWDFVTQPNCFTEFSIRELKKAASKEHIKNYGDMRKSELVEALLMVAAS
jgi:hypothetical protein